MDCTGEFETVERPWKLEGRNNRVAVRVERYAPALLSSAPVFEDFFFRIYTVLLGLHITCTSVKGIERSTKCFLVRETVADISSYIAERMAKTTSWLSPS